MPPLPVPAAAPVQPQSAAFRPPAPALMMPQQAQQREVPSAASWDAAPAAPPRPPPAARPAVTAPLMVPRPAARPGQQGGARALAVTRAYYNDSPAGGSPAGGRSFGGRAGGGGGGGGGRKAKGVGFSDDKVGPICVFVSYSMCRFASSAVRRWSGSAQGAEWALLQHDCIFPSSPRWQRRSCKNPPQLLALPPLA